MPVERCPQCGTPRRADLQVCVRCETPFATEADDVDLALPRPAAPSPTQSHGTVMAALLAGFVLLAVLFGLSVRGVGPFEAKVVSTQLAGNDARVTIEVSNEGNKGGRGRCRIERLGPPGSVQQEFTFLSERVPAKSRITQTIVVPVLPGVRPGQVSC